MLEEKSESSTSLNLTTVGMFKTTKQSELLQAVATAELIELERLNQHRMWYAFQSELYNFQSKFLEKILEKRNYHEANPLYQKELKHFIQIQHEMYCNKLKERGTVYDADAAKFVPITLDNLKWYGKKFIDQFQVLLKSAAKITINKDGILELLKQQLAEAKTAHEKWLAALTETNSNYQPLGYSVKAAKEIEKMAPFLADCLAGNTKNVVLTLTKASKKQCRELITLTDADGNTALHLACMINHPILVQVLLNYGAKVDCENALGFYPIHLAVGRSTLSLEAYSAVEHLTCAHIRKKALIYPKEIRSLEVLEALAAKLKPAKLINLTAGKGKFLPLATAAFYGNLAAVMWLKEKGATLEIKDRVEDTPLHGAAVNGHGHVVAYLLAHVVNKQPINSTFCSPLLIALLAGHVTVAKLFSNNGIWLTKHEQAILKKDLTKPYGASLKTTVNAWLERIKETWGLLPPSETILVEEFDEIPLEDSESSETSSSKGKEEIEPISSSKFIDIHLKIIQ